ncbi:permease [Desulfobacula sp.]|uniref:permease n=1 Tax=Desulfobacula sp. TaxID=2593537 RepID=UPI001EC9A05E|nr:permease [Desulfobacula sp.]
MKTKDFNSLEQPFTIIPGNPSVQNDAKAIDPITKGLYAQIAFIVFAPYILFFHTEPEAITTFSIIFSSIVLEAFPFMLIGALIGGLIEVFVSRDALIKLLPKNRVLSIVLAGSLGIIFPVCECAIVPVVRRLLGKGMPLGAAIAFLLGGPIVNPLVFASTLVAYSFSWDVAFLRLFAGYGIAIAVGLLIDGLFTRHQALVENPTQQDCGCGHIHHHHSEGEQSGLKDRFMGALSHSAQDFYDICKFLIIGAFIAAALQTFVPRQALVAVMTNPFSAIFLMMVLAVMLNLCSEADAFISASFQPLGIPLSAQLSFMVLGPMLDIKLILMYLTVFSKKMIITLTFITLFMVASTMLFLEFSQRLLGI